MSTRESRKGPEEVILELGGCGRFQIRMALLIHLMNIVVAWSLYAMVFVTATPKWWCRDVDLNSDLSYYNLSTFANTTYEKVCVAENGTPCSNFEFRTSDMRTIVTEWNLVCDKAWVPALINSIQVGCQLFGNIFAGHLADYMGRKFPLFLSVVTMILCNLLSYFSVNWLMYGISKALTGIGSGLWLTVRYNFMSEFTLARWRPWLISFPTWPIQGCILALVLWLLKDWRNTHLVIALIGIPFLGAWWLLPESFRWYYAHDRIDDAEKIITKVAKVNRRPVPDMTYMKQLTMMTCMERRMTDKKYTVLDLFKTRFLIKVTLLLFLNWFALGLISYGISFGIQRLAGSLYLNMFLFQLVTIPSKFIEVWLINRIGRRNTAILLFVFTGISAFIVGTVQHIDTNKRDVLTNTFAIIANLGNQSVWGTIQTMTVEIYPTVVRNIGFGLCSTLSVIGAALGPQLVFLEMYVPGILYFCCGGVSVLCVLWLFWLPETKDSNLSDKLNQTISNEQSNAVS